MTLEKLKIIKTILLLVYFSYEDIRDRKISTYLLLGSLGIAVLYLIIARDVALWEYLTGACVGILFLFLSIAGEGIGTGDSVLIMLLGLLLGVRRQIAILFIGVILCAVTAAVLLAVGKVGRKSKLPFVPFLLCAFCILLCGRYI